MLTLASLITNSSVSDLFVYYLVLLTISIRYLLDFLEEKDISATFFVVGSRVIERPAILLEEYMAGHEISVHTWSHSVRYSLSLLHVERPNIVELGFDQFDQ